MTRAAYIRCFAPERSMCLIVLAAGALGCDPPDPPLVAALPTTVASASPGVSVVPPSAASAPPASPAPASPAPAPLADAAPPDVPADATAPEPAEPELADADGGPLPQTEDEPSIDDPVFERHLQALWRAIVADDPEIARGFFFPEIAYRQVKDIKEPEKDWKYRLWKNFVRDVHNHHAKLGKDPDKAVFVELELRNKPAWMKKGKEGNRIGYWRVTRSYLHFENAEGDKGHLDLTSMISWRGHWYVVHLHGFK
jgi:hypothetical protein